MPCARKIIDSCLVSLTVKSKTILKLAGIFIPTSEYMNTIYLNCEKRYEDMIDHRSCTHNFNKQL